MKRISEKKRKSSLKRGNSGEISYQKKTKKLNSSVCKLNRRKKPIKKKAKKIVDKDGSDFDSEEEYGKEQPNSDEESYEMDDGKTVLKDEKAESLDSKSD